MGKCSIASDVGGHRELIDDGNTGVLFRAEDAQSLAQSALAMLASPDRWPAIRAAARQFVVQSGVGGRASIVIDRRMRRAWRGVLSKTTQVSYPPPARSMRPADNRVWRDRFDEGDRLDRKRVIIVVGAIGISSLRLTST